jgi:Sap, sulfolipid-1-addressing protein
MWATVVLMALVAGRGPARIAAVIVISSKSRPVRLLAAYLAGGFGVSLIVGAMVLFVLEGMGVGLRRGLPPYIEIGVGVFALVVAVVVAGGVVGRVRSRIRRRAAARGAAAETGAGEASRGIERLPAFQKLPQPVQNAVLGESLWVACIAGVAVGIPSVYYLAAIAAILAADVRLGSSIAALVVFNVIAFILTEISIVSFVRAPIATRKWVDRLYTWATNRHRLVMGLLPGMVGIYLLVTGISKL